MGKIEKTSPNDKIKIGKREHHYRQEASRPDSSAV